jgi:DNA-binding GntR family transcriptional regulator
MVENVTSFDSPQRSADRENGGGPGAIYNILRAEIIGGELIPGTQLIEGALAKAFGVSRSPIREALAQLTYEGLLERHGRAMRVRVLKAEDILETYEVRIALERTAARAAAERRTELDLGRLNTIVSEMLELEADATARRPKLAHAFHFEIWRASHNATLESILESVHLRVLGLSSTTLHYPERWSTFVAECVEILDAIRERDIERAGETAERQMTAARDFRVQLYSLNPDSPPDRHPLGM